jgi:hypothetical protein
MIPRAPLDHQYNLHFRALDRGRDRPQILGCGNTAEGSHNAGGWGAGAWGLPSHSRAAGVIANPEGGEIVPSCQLYECNQWGVRKSSRDWGRNQLRGLGAQPGNANRPGNCSQFVH